MSPSFHHFYCPFHLFWGFCYCCRSHFLPADSNLPVWLSFCLSPFLAGKLFSLPTLLLPLITLFSMSALVYRQPLLSLNSAWVPLSRSAPRFFTMTQSSLSPVVSGHCKVLSSKCAQAVIIKKTKNEKMNVPWPHVHLCKRMLGVILSFFLV